MAVGSPGQPGNPWTTSVPLALRYAQIQRAAHVVDEVKREELVRWIPSIVSDMWVLLAGQGRALTVSRRGDQRA